MPSLVINAPAKLNLFLFVVGRRGDGYHLVFTLYRKISLWDEIGLSVDSGTTEIFLECPDGTLTEGPENLVWRAAELFLMESGFSLSVRIRLRKGIPVGGGLGGGSSDAASVLKALNQLTGNPLERGLLHTLACRLGSDVPFFLSDGTAAIGRGTGTDLQEIGAPSQWYVLLCPDFGISTRWAYENCILTSPVENTIFRPGEAFRTEYWANDLEQVVMPFYPQIARAKNDLRRLGAEAALMSGSGSTVFGVFPSGEDAERAALSLRHTSPFRTYVVEGL
jgi:4-diphosphocytidyl-2-C-methyl-D-erythritol kinase